MRVAKASGISVKPGKPFEKLPMIVYDPYVGQQRENSRRWVKMQAREIKSKIYWVGAVDWDRRLFEELTPLPDGTSYNSYLIMGVKRRLSLIRWTLP